MSPNTKYLSASALSRITHWGETFTFRTVSRIIDSKKLIAKGTGKAGSQLYDIEEFREACKEWIEKKKNSVSPQAEGLTELRIKKLLEDIEKSKLEQIRLTQEKERASIEIEELKRKMVDADKVYEFLKTRYAFENVLLRRILLVNAPVEVPGLEIVQARIKLEEYFNLIQDCMLETLNFWKDAQNPTESELPDNIKKAIEKLNGYIATNNQ